MIMENGVLLKNFALLRKIAVRTDVMDRRIMVCCFSLLGRSVACVNSSNSYQ